MSSTSKLKNGNFDLSSVNELLANKQLSKNAESFKHVFQSFQSTNSSPEMSFAALAAMQMSRSAADKSRQPQQLPFDMSMFGNMSKIPFDLSKLPIDKSRPAPMPSLQPNTDSKSDYKINDTQTATNCDNTLENPPKFEDLLKNPPKFEDLLKNPSALTMLSQSKQIFPPKYKDDSNMNDDIKKYIDAKICI